MPTENKRDRDLEVKVFWKHRHNYEWRLCSSGGVVIAKGRAASVIAAQAAGEQRAAQQLTEKQ